MDISDIHEVLKISGADDIHVFSDKLIAENKGVQVTKFIESNTEHATIEKKIIDLMPKCGECTLSNTEIKCGKRSVTFQEVKRPFIEITLDDLLADNYTVDRKVVDELLEVDYAISTDEARPILKGIHFDNDTVVALDGYRMALRKSDAINVNSSFTVSAEFVKAFKKIKSTKPVTIEFDNNYVRFTVDDVQIASKLLEGSYINYKSLIPKEFRTELNIETSEILPIINSYGKDIRLVKINMIDGIKLVAENQVQKKKKVKNDKGKYETQYEQVTTATITDEIDAKIKGDEMSIAFNPRYLKDALKDKKNVSMKFTSPISPLFITEDNKLDLVLPIRILKGGSTK